MQLSSFPQIENERRIILAIAFGLVMFRQTWMVDTTKGQQFNASILHIIKTTLEKIFLNQSGPRVYDNNTAITYTSRDKHIHMQNIQVLLRLSNLTINQL